MPMNTGMKPQGSLEPVKTVLIGSNPHPRADSVIDRGHRNLSDRGFYLVGVTVAPICVEPSLSFACFKATVLVKSDWEPENGVMSFDGIGDATPQNCSSPQTGAAYPRMAETRAVSRALAVAFNVADAVAEEIAAGGSGMVAVAAAGVAPAGYAAPAGVPQAAPMAGAPAGVNFNGQGYTRANGQAITGFTKDSRGKQLTDPTVDVGSLQWMADKAMLADKVNPDNEFKAAAAAEIARRNGTAAPQMAFAAPVAAPMAALPPAPVGAIPGAPPAPMTPPPGVAPAPMMAAPPPPAAPAAAWAPSSVDVQTLVNLSTPKGYDWNKLVVEYVQPNFGGRTPQQLTKPEFSSILVAFGGAPLA